MSTELARRAALLAVLAGPACADGAAQPFRTAPTEIALTTMALAEGDTVALPQDRPAITAAIVSLLLTSEVGLAELYEEAVGGDDDDDTDGDDAAEADDPYEHAYGLLQTVHGLIETLPGAATDADVIDLRARLDALMPTPQRPDRLDADPEAAEVVGQALVGALERATGFELYFARDLREGMETVAHLVAHACNARGFDHEGGALITAAAFYYEDALEAPLSIMAADASETIEDGLHILGTVGTTDIDACFDIALAFDDAIATLFPEVGQ